MELSNMLKTAFQQRSLNLLAAKIKENGGNIETADLDSILENFSLLAEKGESFGEETKFIRLDVLRLLGSLNETGRLVFKVVPETISWSNDKNVVTLGGYLVEVRPDGTEITASGFSCGGAALEDVYASEMMSDNKRMSSMLSLASARAEKAAYQNAGIGIEFKGDIFDLETSEAMQPAPKPVLPSPVSQDEKKAKRKARAKKTEEKTEETRINEPEATTAQENTKDEAPTADYITVSLETTVPEAKEEVAPEPVTEPVAETTGEMTLEEASTFTADNGVYKGTKFSEIDENKAKWRCFIWLKKNPPEGGRDERTAQAIDLMISSHPELQKLL